MMTRAPSSTPVGSCATSSTPRPLNEWWLTDITEHPRGEGTLYVCADRRLLTRFDKLLDRLEDESTARGRRAHPCRPYARRGCWLHRGLGPSKPVPVHEGPKSPRPQPPSRPHEHGRLVWGQRRHGDCSSVSYKRTILNRHR